MGRLFGTDGVRGIANTEITNELSMNLGRAAAVVLTSVTHRKPKVLIGTDTRASASMLKSAIAAGLCSVGADVMMLGVVPTPAVAYLVRKYEYDAAVMISASHNPCEYNGIKLFKSDGYKLDDSVEEKIEKIIFDGAFCYPLKKGGDVGRITECKNTVIDYTDYLKDAACGVRFDGMHIALDCANGSASVCAKQIFESLGARCDMLFCEPDGVNINENCGSTHLEYLSEYVKEKKLHAGFAFDGDADRVLAVDENGCEVDGNKILAVCSKNMKSEGKLKNNTVAVTVMTNMGFYNFCRKNGIKYEITAVGDRYVLEKMLEKDYSLGGEQSGHIIFSDYATTGDGELTALRLLKIMKTTGKSLSQLSSVMTKLPQIIINVPVSDTGRERYHCDGEIKLAVSETEKALGENGRVLVRVSGTEPLVRIMLEGEDEEKIKALADELAAVIRNRLM